MDRSIDGPKAFIDNNIIDVFNLLEALRKYSKIKKNIKLIHISTDEVYGDVLFGRSNEKSKYKPSSPYAASKASSDHLVSSYLRTYKIDSIKTSFTKSSNLVFSCAVASALKFLISSVVGRPFSHIRIANG